MKCKRLECKAYCARRIAYSVVVLLLLLSCDNIIQRSTSDYFLYQPGNWWRYVSNGDTILVEVEAQDTIMQRPCMLVSTDGVANYYIADDERIAQYLKITYNFSGDDYTIIEDFITRIELPLVKDNAYQDSLIDSLNIFGQWIRAEYQINGSISEEDYQDTLYAGNVYRVAITCVQNLTTPDTSFINTFNFEEYYAPNIGLISFTDEQGTYRLIDYEIQ